MDLIFAEATPQGRGGVSVVRISGSGARAVAESMAGPLPEPRTMYLRSLKDGDELLDRALVVWFTDGHSFTGEEVAELHLHAAPVVVRRVSRKVSELGARLADPGEFTRRAFVNGQMSLPEVEALGDLLEAETEAQRVLALRSADEIEAAAMRWREILTDAGARVEVSIDFADEEVPDDVPGHVYDRLCALRGEIERQIAGYAAAERIRKGFEVAIIGPPNAGKSSLLNWIAKRPVALVSEIEGTTRDVIELRMDLYGLAVTLLDTAGMRDTRDRVEAMGVEAGRIRAMGADVRIHISENATADEQLYRPGDLIVRSKSDRSTDLPGILAVSSVSGEGISELLKRLRDRLSDSVAAAGLISHERQLFALKQAVNDLQHLPSQPEILAESIRRTAVSLERLLGKIDAEDYLDTIFRSFCIGK